MEKKVYRLMFDSLGLTEAQIKRHGISPSEPKKIIHAVLYEDLINEYDPEMLTEFYSEKEALNKLAEYNCELRRIKYFIGEGWEVTLHWIEECLVVESEDDDEPALVEPTGNQTYAEWKVFTPYEDEQVKEDE